MKKILLIAMLLGALAHSAIGAVLTIPSQTVFGIDVFSGPTYTVPMDFSAADTLSLSVSGSVFLQGNGLYATNAAGVVVGAGSQPVGGSLANGATTFGSLLLGNGSTFVQVFPTNSTNGLGSSNPPTTLLFNGTLGSLFGGGLSAGTVLEFRVSDINTGDNGGQFDVNSATGAVPEPGAWALVASGIAIGFASRRRVAGSKTR